METLDIIYLILIILLFVSIPVFYYVNLNNAKKGIEKYLLERGATNVYIDHEITDLDRDTMSFFVRYTGVKGTKKTTRCKIQSRWIILDENIYWANPLDLELIQIEKEKPRPEFYEFSEKIQSKANLDIPTFEITTLLSINGSEDKIVMMKYIESFKNVFRCKPDGTIVWQADLPSNFEDVYTNIEWKDKYLYAFTRSGVFVKIDVETGKIL